MASVYIQSMMNIYNETRRNILSETMDVLKNKDLLTDEICTVFTDMIKTVCINKKRVFKREKKPRFSGYHIFIKEHREVIKKEQPGIKPQQLTTIVSRAWKHVSEEEKREYTALLDARQANIVQNEKALAIRQEALEAREAAVLVREKTLNEREGFWLEKEKDFVKKVIQFDKDRKELEDQRKHVEDFLGESLKLAEKYTSPSSSKKRKTPSKVRFEI